MTTVLSWVAREDAAYQALVDRDWRERPDAMPCQHCNRAVTVTFQDESGFVNALCGACAETFLGSRPAEVFEELDA